MIKNFIKRIITEVIKELISPELMRFEQTMLSQQDLFRNEMRTKFDDFAKSMEARYEDLAKLMQAQFDDFSKSMEARFEDFSKSIDARFEDFKGFVMGELARISKEIDEIRVDIRNINRRIDDLYQVVVRREEHYSLVEEVRRLRDDVEMLKRKVFQQ
jgi:predicted phage-related endonuclease